YKRTACSAKFAMRLGDFDKPILVPASDGRSQSHGETPFNQSPDVPRGGPEATASRAIRADLIVQVFGPINVDQKRHAVITCNADQVLREESQVCREVTVNVSARDFNCSLRAAILHDP